MLMPMAVAYLSQSCGVFDLCAMQGYAAPSFVGAASGGASYLPAAEAQD